MSLTVRLLIHSFVSVWTLNVKCCRHERTHFTHRANEIGFKCCCFWPLRGLTLLLPRGQMFTSQRKRIDWVPSIYINIFLCSVGSSRFRLMFPLTLPLFLLIVRGHRENTLNRCILLAYKTKIYLEMFSDFFRKTHLNFLHVFEHRELSLGVVYLQCYQYILYNSIYSISNLKNMFLDNWKLTIFINIQS